MASVKERYMRYHCRRCCGCWGEEGQVAETLTRDLEAGMDFGMVVDLPYLTRRHRTNALRPPR